MKYHDSTEQELIESFETSEWVSLKNEKRKYQKIAEENLKKSARINIRLSVKNLMDIKRLAALEGIPYQTFISSILHKYSSGRMKEKLPA